MELEAAFFANRGKCSSYSTSWNLRPHANIQPKIPAALRAAVQERGEALPTRSISPERGRTPPATPLKLFLEERVEHCGPLTFEVSFLLETLFKQSFNSLQRLRPG
jgi:hypothetical protein